MTGWTTERPDQSMYQQTHANIGKYAQNLGEPYIHPDVPMFIPQDGQNCVRIIDPIELLQLKIYFMDVYFHRNVGYKKDYYLCRNRHNIGACPICEVPDETMWDTNKDLAKSYLPDWRRLMWVLDLNNPAEAGIVKLWSAPRTLSDEILAQSRNPQLDTFVEVSDPVNGVPVYFNKTGKGLNTKYSGVQLGQQAMPVGAEIAEQRFQFMDILIVPEYETVSASFHMQQPPPEAGEQTNVPHTASGYDQQAATPPAHEVGAAEASRLAREAEVETPGSGPNLQYDYSDLDTIQPENRECFRVHFDEYNECEVCVDRPKCGLPWPTVEVKQAKPSRPAPGAAGKTAKPAPAGGPERVTAGNVAAGGATVAGAGPGPARVTAGAGAPAGGPIPGGGPAPGPAPVQQPNPNATSAPQGDNTQSILSAQEKLRAEIAKRKGQG